PTTNSAAIATGTVRNGFMPARVVRKYVVYAPSIKSGPCAMLITRMTPKISPRPNATIAYRLPARMPETMTCPSIAGVTTTFTTTTPGPAGGLARRPGWRGEARLGLRQIVGPHGGLLLLLPLEGHHLVRDLKAVGLDLVVAEDRAHLELQELLAHPIGVEAVRALGGLAVDDPAPVPPPLLLRPLLAALLPF